MQLQLLLQTTDPRYLQDLHLAPPSRAPEVPAVFLELDEPKMKPYTLSCMPILIIIRHG